jgi:hypothetical protein
VTTDHGTTWVERDPVASNPNLRFDGLFIDPTNANTAYVVATSFGDDTGGGHIWKTTNAGVNWTDISGDFPDIPVWSIAVDTETSTLYIGTDSGVWASTNGGAHWGVLGNGLAHAQVVEVEINKNLGILAAGTHGRGLWELAIPPKADTWATVGPNVNIDKLSGNHAESTIAINPTNPLNLFAADTLGDPSARRYSLDGGVTWHASTSTGLPASIGDVQTAWDKFGNLFLVYLTPSVGTVVVRSSDGGATFKDARTIASSGTDQPEIAVGPSGTSAPGAVWVAYNGSGNNWFAVGAPVMGLDMVGAFGTPMAMPGGGGNFGGIAIGPNGQVMTTYQNNGSGAGPDTIKINVKPDGLGPGPWSAQSIATSTNVGGFLSIPAEPSRTIDADAFLAWDRSGGPHNGRVYLLYTDRANLSTVSTQIYVRYSDNNGATWSDPVRINDDPLTDGKSHFWPAIAVDQTTGAVAVTWYDTRNSGSANNTTQIFGTASFDGGVTWSPNIQISAGTSQGTAAGSFEYGDYDRMDFYAGVFYRTWADNSDITSDNPNGILHGLNVYTAKVTVGSSISGTVFNDLDGDGIHDPGEPGLAGWTVFLDLNNDGKLDPGDPSTVTSATGSYTFSNPPVGTYAIREILQPGWTQTAPPGGSYTVTVTSTLTAITGKDFGNRSGTVTGNVFNDLNGNGTHDPGEPGLSGWVIFDDTDNNGILDPGEISTVSDSAGNYFLSGLAPGEHTIREVVPPGWVQTAPSGSSYTVTIAGPTTVVAGKDFGNFQLATISGTVFNDLNGDGIHDPGEPGLAGWTVFLDLNNDGKLDPGDPSTVTSATGSYTFTNLGPGTYIVREVPQDTWVQSAPAAGFYSVTPTSGQTVTGRDFGNFQFATITGTKFNDLDQDGVQDPGEPGLAGWTVYVDLNNSGQFAPGDPFAVTDAGGHYTIANVPPGTYHVREVRQPGWVRTLPSSLVYPPNSGFEDGNFNNWTTLGSTSIKTASFGTGPTEGTYDALITNDSGPLHTTVESFLGLAPNALNTLVSNVTNGSAIKYTVTAAAGDTLSFDWNFLTNEAAGETTYRDFGFVSITPVGAGGALVKLADTTSSLVAAPAASGFSRMTGFHTFTFTFTTAGTYTIGVGAMNAGDQTVNSALLVDNFIFPPVSSDGSYTVTVTSGQNVAGKDFGNYHTAVTPVKVIDDGDHPGFNTTGGGWRQVTGQGGYQGNFTLHELGAHGGVALYHLNAGPVAIPQTFELFATWVARPGNASNATYRVYDGDTLIATVVVDQRVPASDVFVGGTGWKELGIFTRTTDDVRVELDGAADGDVVADAVLVAVAPPATAGPRVVSSNPGGTVSATSLNSITFTFSDPMDTSSFTLADGVVRFTGPGNVDLKPQITGFSWNDAATVLTITFSPQTAGGTYVIAIGPHILRASDGAPMDQDDDGLPGETPGDQYQTSFDFIPSGTTQNSGFEEGGGNFALGVRRVGTVEVARTGHPH